MKPFHVKFKTSHNVFFRHIWRVVSASVEQVEDEPSKWVFLTRAGKRFEVPVAGTVLVFGRGYSIT